MSYLMFKHCCLCILFVCISKSRGAFNGPIGRPERFMGRPTKGPCGSTDIRNNVEQFQKLANCTVIEGELQILLIDYAQPEDYNSLHFPDLVEIKDFLLLYRVQGLRSLRNIFPNLAVIRGEKLFSNYALIAFEMQSLEELGLVSLTSIPKGAVRLEASPNLCYIETIDWTKIATGVSEKDNFFKGNKDTKECVNMCDKRCDKTMGYDQMEPRCWTRYPNDCQRMLSCPASCPTGLCYGGTCCNPNCIGGCTGPDASDCIACKDVIQYQRQGKKICAKNCSAGTFEFKNRRCLLHDQCVNFTDYPISQDVHFKLVIPAKGGSYKPGLCVDKCPAGTREDNKDMTQCVPCVGKCPKLCAGKIVDSINSAQELKGCTTITGPLEINIMGGSHIGQELEDNLSEIEEVTEHIRIYHSYALLSLYFLKNLKVIHGSKLYQDRYSLVVFDNLNLQELFLEEVAKNLTLLNGTVWFQYNRKLCYKKIETFVKMIGHEGKTKETDISKETNGDQMPCDIQQLGIAILRVTPHIAIFSWEIFNITDPRHLISYTINFKEAPVKNVSIYQGRDACSDDLWKTVEVPPDRDPNATVIHAFITSLKPWTQYAVYVQTLTISKAIEGAISKVIYFRTAAEVPTSPTNLRVRAEHPGELHITWDPPLKPNGNVTHYEVYWQLRDLDRKNYELRDYCAYPLMSDVRKREEEEKEEEEKNKTLSGQCCECPPSAKQLEHERQEREMQIQFQDFLQNQVYIKRLERPATTLQPNGTAKRKPRSRRQVPTDPPDPHEKNKYTYDPSPAGSPTINLPHDKDGAKGNKTLTDVLNTTNEINNTWPKENPYYKAFVYEERDFHIPSLGHFEDYNIEVIACQERDPREPDRAMLCSHRAIGLGRTLPNKTADNINSSTIKVDSINNRTGAVHIRWQDPPHPNGLIITYELEYSKSKILNVKPTLICITYKMYRDVGKNGHTLENLGSGNYTFRLRTTSLAGNSSWTEPMFFNIPDLEGEEMTKEVMIAIILACLVFVVLIAVLIVWIFFKKKFGDLPKPTTSINPDYVMDFVYEPDEWEVDRDKVQLIRELGQGSFGMVYEGIVKNIVSGKEETKVAVKTTNSQSSDYDRYMFLQEISMMKGFTCHHVVRLIGVVSKGQPAYVLMELMANGDLKHFLRLHRPDEEENDGRQPPTLRQIMQIAGEIADGMAYLADKKYVHRDLAARNCMVGEDMTVKIGDFGMTRDIYETDYYRKGNRGLLPVRWMAPESLLDGVFTSMSDVWSYGVVLWEMATLAAQPYQGLSNEEVVKYVGSGKIMDTPERCPPKLFDLMVKCWRFRQKQRPTFKEIIEILLPDLDKNFQEVSYFFSEEAKQATTNHHTDITDYVEEDDTEDGPGPMNDYIDEANLPFLHGAEASNGVELNDIFTDNGSYPTGSYPWNHRPAGSSDVCGCNLPLLGNMDEGAAAHTADISRQSDCSSPNSAIGGSSDGSKGSSKSSSSSYAHMNGLSVANGHVPAMHVRTTPC